MQAHAWPCVGFALNRKVNHPRRPPLIGGTTLAGMSETSSDRAADAGAPRRVSKLWYLAPVAVMAVGVGLFLATLSVARADVERAIAEMPRVVFPPGGEVEIDRAGEVTIYYETRSAVDGVSITANKPQRRIELRVTPPGAERAVEATNIHWREEGAREAKAVYDHLRYAGFAAWRYDAPEPGTYTLRARYSDAAARDDGEAAPPTFVAAVGRLDPAQYFNSWTGIFGGASAVAAAMVVAVVLATVIYVRRNPGRWQRSEHGGAPAGAER